MPGLTVITSLAGRTKQPAQVAGKVRVGGFGGPEGLAAYLEAESIGLLIDAAHPFAAQMAANADRACAEAGVARLKLLRPAWQAVAGDSWIEVANVETAARAVAERGRRVFLTVGRQDLAAFAGLDGVWFLVRSIEPAPCPLADCTMIQGRGPFTESDEIALLKEHRIDTLVSKNSGGAATYAKIAAARSLGLPVVMIARPAAPPGDAVESVDQAVSWVKERL